MNETQEQPREGMRKSRLTRTIVVAVSALGVLAILAFVWWPSGPPLRLRVTEVEVVQDIPSGDKTPEHCIVTFEITNLTARGLEFANDNSICAITAGGAKALEFSKSINYLGPNQRSYMALLVPRTTESCLFCLDCTPASPIDKAEEFLRYGSPAYRFAGMREWVADHLPKPHRHVSLQIFLPSDRPRGVRNRGHVETPQQHGSS